jgi:glyceraldehyde 3-phosphate dehydrogenase
VYNFVMARVAINGFGRIGRLFFRQAFGHKDLDVVAINDLAPADNLAYLLKYDTVYRRYEKQVSVRDKSIVVGGTNISFSQEKDPTALPWKKLKVDIVVEATGVFAAFEKARVHLDAGAKRVVITAPAKDPDGTEGATVLVGINDDKLESLTMSSNASCTTNAASPVIEIVRENPGVLKAVLNTVHGYTATQSIVDAPSKKMRRGRAAAQNIIPSTTGAAQAVARAIPSLIDKFDGIAMRVPVVAGSIADITFVAKRKTSVEEINDIFIKACSSPRWQGIVGTTDDPLVSSDIIGQEYGAIIDLSFTRVVDGDLVKVLSWYDNEWGYVSTLVRHVVNVSALV